MAPITLALWSSLFVVGRTSEPELFSTLQVLAHPNQQQKVLFALDCERYLVGESFSKIERLEKLCMHHGFSQETCEGAFLTLNGGPFTRKDAKPLCETLESSKDSGYVIAALQHRQGRTVTSRAHLHSHLEKVVSGKKGQPDYLVSSDDPQVYEAPPAPLAHPPPAPTDLTIAQPPDADGNPYNQVQWGVNGEAGAAPAALSAAPATATAEAEAPAEAEAQAPAEAEAPAAEAEAPAETPVEAEAVEAEAEAAPAEEVAESS